MGQRPKLHATSDPEGPAFPFLHIAASRPRPLFVGGASGEDDDDDDESTNGATVPIGRFLKMQQRMKAADRRASAAEARVAELEPIAAKVPDLEKLTEQQTETIRALRMDNAFLSSDIDWVDAEAALKLADLSNVKVADDGTVTGLEDALKALAEKKPFLVKPKKDEGDKGKGKGKRKAKDEDEDDEDDEDLDDEETDEAEEDEEDDDAGDQDEEPGKGGRKLQSVQGGASGTSTGTGKRRRKGSKGPTDEELMRRYRI